MPVESAALDEPEPPHRAQGGSAAGRRSVVASADGRKWTARLYDALAEAGDVGLRVTEGVQHVARVLDGGRGEAPLVPVGEAVARARGSSSPGEAPEPRRAPSAVARS